MALTNAGLADIGLGNGVTAAYAIMYDTSLPTGLSLARGLLAQCGADYALMVSWFSGQEFPRNGAISVNINNASGGASWQSPSPGQVDFTNWNLTVQINPGSNATLQVVRYLLVSEVTEMFMWGQDQGWWYDHGFFKGGDEGSKGEGLSRFLGVQWQLANGFGEVPPASFSVTPLWLNGPRADFVNNNPDDENPDATTGCTTLFLYYLHNQLGYSIPAIINAAASNLTGVYQKLTGQASADGWAPFISLVNSYYPPGATYNPPSDNLFPVSDLSSITAPPTVVCGAAGTINLSINNPAKAEVNIQLSSGNTALLTIQQTVTITPGATSTTVPVQAVPQILPFAPEAATILATYGNKTFSTSITVVPPSLVDLTVVPINVICGDSASATLTLNFPSLKGPANATVASSNPSVLQVPQQVAFSVGNLTSAFTITTSNIHVPFSPVPVIVSAQLSGSSVLAVVNVVSPTVADLQILPSGPIALSAACTGTVTLDRASFDGDVIVDLFWEPPNYATTNPQVTVKQGAISANFPITAPAAIPPFGLTQGLLYASYAGTDVSAWLTLAAGPNTGVLSSVVVRSPVVGGAATSGLVQLQQAVVSPTVVTLRTAPTVRVKPGTNPVLPVAHVPSSVTIAADQTGAGFPIATEPLSSSVTDRTVGIVANAFVTRTAILTFER